MVEIVLVYFEGCPNASRARALLERLGFPFIAIDQLSLPEGDPKKDFSSPSILLGDEIIYGSKTTGGSEGCSISPFDESKIEQNLRAALKKGAVTFDP